MQPGRDSHQFIETIIKRLEVCFKKISATFEEYKNNKIESSIPRPTYVPTNTPTTTSTISTPPRARQIDRVPKERGRKQKTVVVDNVDLNKYFSQMTELQKDDLRDKIMREKPKPPMNAFIAYVKAQKDRIKGSSTKNLSIAQITAIASEEWKSLEQEKKMPYITVYHLEHAEYTEKMNRFMKQNPILKKLKMKKLGPKKIYNRFKIPAPTQQKEKQESIQDQCQESDEDSLGVDSELLSSSEVKNPMEQPVFSVVQLPRSIPKPENTQPRQQSSEDRIRIQSYEERIEPVPGSKKLMVASSNERVVKLQEKYQNPPRMQSKIIHSNFGVRPQQNQILKNEAKEKIMDILKAKKAEKILNHSHDSDDSL